MITKTIDFKQILQVLKKKLMSIVLLTLLMATGFGIYSKFMITPVYQAKTTLLLKYESSTSTDGQIDSNKEWSSSNLYKNLLKTYVDMGNLSTIKSQTIESLDLTEEEQSSIQSVTTTSTEDSQLITITARGTDKSVLIAYLTRYGETYVEFATNHFETNNLSVLTESETTGKPVNVNILRNIILGGMLGAGMSMMVILIRYLLADRISSLEELESLLDLPVVGSIPDYANTHKGLKKSSLRRKKR